MAERKIFAGARLKRLRQRLGLSQMQMAVEIGISASYLNLIERDQRPLTVQVLLKLSAVYGVDVAELSAAGGAATVEALRQIFSDPLLAGEIASPAELSEFAAAAPNAASGMARLHAAYSEALERLSNLSQLLARDGEPVPEASLRMASAQVAAVLEEAGPWIPELEATAEALATELKPRDDPWQALRWHLREGCGVDLRILPDHVMPVEQLRFDRHSQRLFLSERVPLIERPFLVARQIALLRHGDLLGKLAGAAGFTDPEALRIARLAYARRLAEAMLAPASRLAPAAQQNLDVLRLSERFLLRPSRIMSRLSATGAGGVGLPAAFMVMIDASGGVLQRIPGAGFPYPRLGPFCARLPLFDGLQPGHPVSAEVRFPDAGRFRVTAIAEDGPRLATLPPPRRLALIGWSSEGEETSEGDVVRPVGVACRLCERFDCAHRLHQPLAFPSGFQEHVVGASDHELIG